MDSDERSYSLLLSLLSLSPVSRSNAESTARKIGFFLYHQKGYRNREMIMSAIATRLTPTQKRRYVDISFGAVYLRTHLLLVIFTADRSAEYCQGR